MHEIEAIIYVGDPMCSWCWGFAPEFKKLRAYLEPGVRFAFCAGNLRNGHVWDKEFRHFLKTHWDDVNAKSGQPFDYGILDRNAFDYTTEPACRALCTGRKLDETKLFPLLEALQRAFYREGRDITDSETICSVAAETGYDRAAFETLFASQEMRSKVQSDAFRARAYGATVFPSLVVIDKEGHLSVLKGYRTFETLKKMLQL